MARDRSIALRVVANVHDAVRGLEDVGRAAGQVGDRADETGRKSQTLTQRVAQSARDQRQEWQQVGTAVTTYGAAVTGLGGLVVATGVNYNSLRQTAQAAMTSVTGSTEDAAEQMRRLDEYGQNSWLMRDTLVQAQQQMTGFGISTEKVIPYMDALAEATAATGGNNQDFLEMAQIMGQIQSQGRITARELDRFGQRGVDAATLIGEAMGMTAGQVRDEISTGAFDAATALDALASGMVERYGGASDLVRDTFRGAVDDVMAAFRDLSAGLMTPFVDPEGGGIFVSLLNQVADLMRGFEQLPGPIRDTAAGLGLLTGPVALAAGGFLLLAPRVVATWDALANMGSVGLVARGALRGIGSRAMRIVPQLAAAAAGFWAITSAADAIQDHFRDARLSFDQLSDAMQRGDLSAPLDRLSSSYSDLESVGQVLFGSGLIDRMDRGLSSLNQALGGFFPDDIAEATDELARMGEVLAHMALEEGDVEGAQEIFQNIATTMGATTDELMEFMPAWQAAMDEIGNTPDFSEMYQRWMDNQAAINEAREALEEYREAQREVAQGFLDLGSAFDEGWDLESVTQHIRDQAEALGDYRENLRILDDRISDLGIERGPLFDFIDDLDPMVAAEFVAELAGAEDVDLYDIADALGLANDEAEEFADELERIKADEEGIHLPVELETDEARTGFEDLVDGIEGTSPNTELHLNPKPAIKVFDAETGRWRETTTDTFINADADMGIQVFSDLTNEWMSTTTDTLLDLNPDEAVRVFDSTTGTWIETTTDTLLDLDPGLAERVFGSTTGDWRNTTTDTNLDANDDPARRSVYGFGSWAGGYTATVNVDANVAAARRAIRSMNQERIAVGATLIRNMGGPVFGPGSETSDSIPAMLSNNEHVLSAREVRGLGGHGAVEQMRAMARAGVRAFADGGTPAYAARPAAAQVVRVQSSSGEPIHQTVNNYGIPADRSEEFASATLFAMRRGARGSLHGRGVAHA